MKNIITAILDPEINKKLNNNKQINVVCKDILYQEAIFEILEKNNNIDFVILNSDLPGEKSKEELIDKIYKINKNIKIIYFLNQNEEIKNKKIYRNLSKQYLKYEIIEKIILDKNIEMENNILEKNKIIFLGNKGAGKSIILANIALIISKQNIKTLILDFDSNNTIFYMFNLKNKKIEENGTIKINSNLFYYKKHGKNFIKIYKLLEMIYKFEKEFDIILTDTTGDFSENEKILVKKSNKKIFITEANLTEINKTKIILEKYKNKKIRTELFEIILNKNNLNSIDDNLVKKIFKNKIIGKINYSNKFNSLINENMKQVVNKSQINKIIKQMKGIYKNEFRNKYRKDNSNRKTIQFFRNYIRKSN